ncbi:basic leucine zipper 4 [Prosopis cineraria]|uniref:basic leucine zipper 4 n=1 Tax=Prosopis cineraria TaxID=364024 RepID=UPI0024105D30|nr:basic leucine zipper 4 [Prosopis cineraria]
MLSTLSPSHPFLGNPFSSFEGGLTPWEFPDLSSVFNSTDPVINSSSGSDEPDRTHNAKRKSPSSDDQPDRPDFVMEDRKRRRMISNRESARRSRMRKQRHLENLRNEVNRFRMENRDLKNRMQFLLHLTNRARTENEWLRSERIMLRQKLLTLTQYLVFQQPQRVSSAWPCNTSVTARINLDRYMSN